MPTVAGFPKVREQRPRVHDYSRCSAPYVTGMTERAIDHLVTLLYDRLNRVETSATTGHTQRPFTTTFIRSMPFDRPGSLNSDEVYSLTAWLLFRNGIIAEDAVLDAESLPLVVMPNLDGFVLDDREEFSIVK